MNLDEQVSNTRMFLWSLAAIAGVLLLALFTPDRSAGTSDKRCYYNRECTDPAANRVQFHARDIGDYLNIEMDFIRGGQPENPALACRAPNQLDKSVWSQLLTRSAKQLVISFDL